MGGSLIPQKGPEPMLPIELHGGALVYFSVLALALGVALGSFLNCAAWRIARGESFVRGRSRCPACGRTLSPGELVPILSWLFQRGRCRGCGAPISPRYPLTEAAFALLTWLTLLRCGPGVEFLRDLGFFCCLFCLTLTDLEIGEIPDGCLIAAAVIWALASPFLMTWGGVLRNLGAGLFYGAALLGVSLVLDRVLKKDSLGGGDIKLFAAVGLYLGWTGTLFVLVLSCLLGLALAALLRRRAGEPFPFGPAIAAAAALMLLYGQGVTAWYLGLLGL